MPVKLRWRDNASVDAGHRVYRKSSGDTTFTAIADLNERLPSETGIIYWTDTDTLPVGDYTYKIDNYTQSGTTGTTQETTISVFNSEDLRLCLSLDDNFADACKRHTILNYGASIAPLSGAYFNNTYLQSDTSISFPSKFSLSFAIYPEGTNSTNSTLLICRDNNSIDSHIYLQPNGKIKWISHDGYYGLESVNVAVTYDQWNYIHITGDASINKRHIYINGVEGYCCASWGGEADTSNVETVMSIGQDPVVGTTTSFKGYISDIALIHGQVTVPNTCHICPLAPVPLVSPSNVQVTITDYPGHQSILKMPSDVTVTISQDQAGSELRAPSEVEALITY